MGCLEAGVPIEDVVEYVVYDENSRKVIANIGVRGKSCKDPSFTARIGGPKDIATRIVCRTQTSVRKSASCLCSFSATKLRRPIPQCHIGQRSFRQVFHPASQSAHRSVFHDFRCRDIGGSRGGLHHGGDQDRKGEELDGRDDAWRRHGTCRSIESMGSNGVVDRLANSGVSVPVFWRSNFVQQSVQFVQRAYFGCDSVSSSRVDVSSHPRGSESTRTHLSLMHRHEGQTAQARVWHACMRSDCSECVYGSTLVPNRRRVSLFGSS